MTVQTINIGNVVNDGLGDDLRTAFEKVNANFASLDSELAVTGLNLGTVGVGIFNQKTGATLEFKRLTEGINIGIDEYDEYLLITNTAPDAFIRIDTDGGTVSASTYPQVTIGGAPAPGSYSGINDIEVTAIGSSIKIKNTIPVSEILTTYDFGTISGSTTNAIQFALAWANIDFGTFIKDGIAGVSGASTIDLDCGSI